MESKTTGAYEAYLKKRAEVEEVKKWILENNIQPITRDEFWRQIGEARERNIRGRAEKQNKDNNQTPSDNAA